MRQSAYLFLVSLFWVVSCAPAAPSFTAPAEMLPLPAVDTLTPTCTLAAPPAPMASARPSQTPQPLGVVIFYRLRIEFSTTSDWSTLELLNPSGILTARAMSSYGDPVNLETGVPRLALNQPLEAAEEGHSVGVTMDYALDAAAIGQPLEFRLQKGALNGSQVRLLWVSGDDAELIRAVDHRIIVKSDPGLNPLTFSVELERLEDRSPQQVRIQPATSQKMIWAFYYPWYTDSDWSSPGLNDHPLLPYASASHSIIERHIEQAQGAGIDGFISSWWGPGSETDENLKTLLNLAQEKNFGVSIYFETLTDEGPRSEAEIYHWLTYAIATYRQHPAFMKIDGKPVIVVWASGAVPLDAWKRIFDKLRQQGLDAVYLAMGYDIANLEVFDGVHEYGVFTIPDIAQAALAMGHATHYYPLLADHAAAKIWAATVQPGYDERLIPGRQGLFKEREGGAYYRATFEAALQSEPDWIFITSWNEWWEHTHIEPGERYGDLYLQITHEYVEKWKGESVRE